MCAHRCLCVCGCGCMRRCVRMPVRVYVYLLHPLLYVSSRACRSAFVCKLEGQLAAIGSNVSGSFYVILKIHYAYIILVQHTH